MINRWLRVIRGYQNHHFFWKKNSVQTLGNPKIHWFLTVFAREWGTSTPSSIRIHTVHHIYHIINYIYVYAYYVQTWHLIFWDNKETHVKRLRLSKDRWWSSCFLKLLLGGKTNFQRHTNTHTRDMFIYIYMLFCRFLTVTERDRYNIILNYSWLYPRLIVFNSFEMLWPLSFPIK